MNLLKETMCDIMESGHTPKDIIFIGSERTGHSCTWDEYVTLANIEYDNGFGSQKIADDLIIVFKDGCKMWRSEYDGSESWGYSKPFKMPEDLKPIKALTYDGCMWESLNEIQENSKGVR